MTDVPSAEVAAELRRAGAGEVDASTRRRAEYSSDASNYRVVPRAVALPAARRRGRWRPSRSAADSATPSPARGAGTSIAGNAIGPGVVLDFSRHLNRVLSVDPEARTAVVEPGAVLDCITARRGRTGCEFGPTRRPTPAPPSADDRQQRLRRARAGLRPHRRQRRRPRRPDRDRCSLHRPRLRPGRLRRGTARVPMRAALDGIVRDLGDDPHRVRPVRPAGLRLLAGAPAAGERLDVARFLVRHRGHAGGVTRAQRSGWCRAAAATALAVLGYPDMPAAADAVPAAAAARPAGAGGHGRPAGRGGPLGAGARRGARRCRAAAAGCSSRPAARPRPRRSLRRRARSRVAARPSDARSW